MATGASSDISKIKEVTKKMDHLEEQDSELIKKMG